MQEKYNQLKKQIKQAEEFSSKRSRDEFIAAVKQAIEKGESVLIPGGLGGKDPETVYFEVIPEKGGSYTVRVYNLGKGIEHIGESERYAMSYVDWKGISKESLEGPGLKSIYELANAPDKQELSPKHIYIALKNILSPKEETLGKITLKAPTELGNSSWKSLTAFLFAHLEKTEFKQLMSDIKLQVIFDASQSILKSHQASTKDLRELKHSIKKTGHFLEMQIKRKHISPAYVKSALEELAKIVKEAEEKALKSVKNEEVTLAFQSVDGANLPSIRNDKVKFDESIKEKNGIKFKMLSPKFEYIYEKTGNERAVNVRIGEQMEGALLHNLYFRENAYKVLIILKSNDLLAFPPESFYSSLHI